MKKTALSSLLLACLFLASCSDATSARYDSLGKKHKIMLYSGGVKVKEWTSTGSPRSVADEDGWRFVDSETKRLVYITGDIIIETVD